MGVFVIKSCKISEKNVSLFDILLFTGTLMDWLTNYGGQTYPTIYTMAFFKKVHF